MIRLTSKYCVESLPKCASASANPLRRGFATSKAESPTETQTRSQTPKDEGTNPSKPLDEPKKTTTTKKTIAQLDEEMKMKMSGLAGDGGESGVEYEDGQPVAMKRSVKSNMFRYI